MIYVINDIHGFYRELYSRIDQMGNLAPFEDGENKLILLGDYIDRGPDSKKVLEMIFNWQQFLGTKNMVVLRGNHEVWFLDFLDGNGDKWFREDENLNTSRTFLTEEQLEKVNEMVICGNAKSIYSYIRNCISEGYKDLIAWLRQLPHYYETENQIFVHAGIDEEAEDWWKHGTPDYVFSDKHPATTGRFYKDIIAGHIAALSMPVNKDFKGIHYDGESHFYIDGCVENTGYLPVLAYDEKTGNYYSLEKEDKRLRTRKMRLIVRGDLTRLN